MAQAARRKPAAKRPLTQAERTPALEWAAAAVGLTLIVGTAGVLGYELVRGDETPPRIVVRQIGQAAVEGGHLIIVEVDNAGGNPAAGVVVEGVLTGADGRTETAEATFDFVANASSQKGGLMFAGDPAAGRVELRAKGFTEP